MLVPQVEAVLPALATTCLLVDRFVTMVRNGTAGKLTKWLFEAATSEIASFSADLIADRAAMVDVLREPWSNGRTERQLNRPKTIKGQIYGRADIELLKACLLATS